MKCLGTKGINGFSVLCREGISSPLGESFREAGSRQGAARPVRKTLEALQLLLCWEVGVLCWMEMWGVGSRVGGHWGRREAPGLCGGICPCSQLLGSRDSLHVGRCHYADTFTNNSCLG